MFYKRHVLISIHRCVPRAVYITAISYKKLRISILKQVRNIAFPSTQAELFTNRITNILLNN